MDLEEEITNAVAVRPYVIEVEFADGRRAQVDVEDRLFGEVFLPLRDPAYFGQGKYDQTVGTIVWPNGADFSPEFFNDRAFAGTINPERKAHG